MLDDPTVKKWLSGYDKGDWAPRTSNFKGFLRYLNCKPSFEDVTPSRLLEFHRRAVVDSGEYRVVDLLQEYVKRARYNVNKQPQ